MTADRPIIPRAEQPARDDEDEGVLAGGIFRYGLALLYAFALCYAYDVLSTWWAYFGFTYKLNDDSLRYAACFVAAGPAVMLVSRPRTFAEAAAWFLYVLVFLPCLLVPVMQYASGPERLLQVFLATLAGCLLFLWLVRGQVRRVSVRPAPPRVFWWTLGSLWLGMLILILFSYGTSYQFVGTEDIYTQRFAGAEVAGNAVVRYSMAILSNAIDPFLIAYGLRNRRYWIAGAGTAAQIFLFGTLAARSVLLSPVFVLGAFLLADRRGGMRGNLLLVGLLGIFVLTFPLLVRYDPVGGGLNQLVSLLHLRTMLIAGAAFGVYDQFFAVFPHTYYSSSNIVAQFVQYPYGDLSVGQAVQQMLTPTSSMDIPELNANFLATDGVAAIGLAGIPLISAVAAILLRTLSKFVSQERTMMLVAGGTGFLVSLSNGSLLTSLVTGGGLLIVALVCLAPADRD